MTNRLGMNDVPYDASRLNTLTLSSAVASADVDAITALTGDVTATGPGSVAATLATVNANVGTFGSATQVAQVTANAKGLITAISNVTITGASPVGASLTRGSIWRGGATNLAEAYALGAANKVLQSDGTDAIWSNFTLTISGNSTINGSLIGNITGGGTLATGGFTLTVPKTGTAAIGTGTAGRIAEWVTDVNTLQASTLAKSGAGVLTLSAASAFTLTVPATGTAALMDYANTGSFSASGGLNLGTGSGSGNGAITAIGSGTVVHVFKTAADSGRVLLQLFNGSGSSTGIFDMRAYGDNYSETLFGQNMRGCSMILAQNFYSGSAFFIGSNTNTPMTLVTNSTKRLTITAAGRVIVGAGSAPSARFEILGSDNIVQLLTTGSSTQPTSTTVAQIARNDANTNTIGTMLVLNVNSTGTAANGFGGSIALNLESSTTADQAAASIKWLWTDATHATKTSRADIETTGPGKCAAWGYNGIDGTARTIIANGTGDVTEGITVQYVASEVTGTDSFGGVAYLEPGDSFVINTDATNVLTLACAADGSVTVQRTSGTDTYKFQCWAVWV